MTRPPMPEPANAQTAGATTAPKSPWEVDVYVYLDSVTDPNDPQVRIETCLPLDSADPQNRTIVFHNRHRKGFNISFHFEDLTGGNYRFPQLRDDPIWSQMGPTCPTVKPRGEVLEPKSVEQNGERLVVHNPNSGAVVGQFKYSLRVTNGGVPIILDPGGDNQNGPVQ